MKKMCLALLLCVCSSLLYAQSRITEVEYQKVSRPAIVNEVPFASKTVEKAIEEDFAKKGYKGTSSKGFTVYKGVRLPQLGPDAYDIYFMAEKKSRRDNDNSTVTMMITKGFDAFVSQSTDATLFGNAQTYLDSLRNIVAVYDLEQQILAQEDELKKADKKNESLKEEAKDLEKKKKKLEDQIEDNIKDQKNQEKEVEKQKQILETLKANRK